MICVVVLQNGLGFVEGETGVKYDVDGSEEVGFKVEEAIDIKDEIPEAISFPSIKTEHEVRLWVFCEVVAAHAFRPFIDMIRKLRNYTQLLCVILWMPCTFFKFGLQS